MRREWKRGGKKGKKMVNKKKEVKGMRKGLGTISFRAINK